MTLKQLEAFYWAAKLGTFAIAAERLHVTQSSLSKRVAELEADLDQTLFDRSSRRAALTRAGEILLEKAAQMLEFERDIRASLDQQQQVRGTCRFGLSELVATTWFPSLAARVDRDYGALTLEPQVGLARGVERAVISELDVATLAGPSTSHLIGSEVIAEVEFVWASSPSRLRRGTLLTAEHFTEHPVIDNTQESGLTSVFGSWATSNGVKIGKNITCNSRTAIIALTIAGVGISLQPRKYVSPLFERGVLVPLRCRPELPKLAYHFISRRDDSRALVDLVRELVMDEADFGANNLVWA
jgi:DNA-binding transcriptional LysR family regulator